MQSQPVSNSSTYVVRPGDTLTAIAARNTTIVAALARANRLDPARPILIGARLKLPAAAPRVIRTALAASPSSVRDTLDRWSVRLGMSQSLIRALAWMESAFSRRSSPRPARAGCFRRCR